MRTASRQALCAYSIIVVKELLFMLNSWPILKHNKEKDFIKLFVMVDDTLILFVIEFCDNW